MKNMRRVLFIAPFIWEAGPYIGKPTIYNIMRGFQRAGYEVHVVSATNRPGLHEQVFEGLKIHYFRLPLPLLACRYDAMASFLTLVRTSGHPYKQHLRYRLFWLQFLLLGTRRALQVSRRFPPKLTYGIMNTGVPVAYFLARRRRIPNFSRITGSAILHYLDSPLRLWLARFDEYLAFKLPCSGLIITRDGSTSEEEIHDQLRIPSERIWLWRNGVDKDSFTLPSAPTSLRSSLGLEADARMVLSVSQLVDVKRIDLLIEAIPEVVAEDPRARFVIVGEGPEKGALQRRVRNLGVSSFVRFAGSVPREQIPAYYQAADVFAAFYPYANISNSLLEAMLSGNAVVTLDNGHTSDVIRHLENGFLVSRKDLGRIPAALLQILRDDALRERLGRAAREYARSTLQTWEERIQEEINRIEGVLESDSAG